MSNDTEFVNGLFVKKPHSNSPDFVKCSISIKRADFGNWLRANQDEWINIDVKESRNGKWYASVNDWKPEKQPSQPLQPSSFEDDDLSGLPF